MSNRASRGGGHDDKETGLASGGVGIVNLGNILKEVANLKLAESKAIKKESLERVKIYNYVAPGSEAD
ncbi:MAG: hypothetical protein ACLFVD_02260 [Dehalococcoidia bacterium]